MDYSIGSTANAMMELRYDKKWYIANTGSTYVYVMFVDGYNTMLEEMKELIKHYAACPLCTSV